MGSDGRVISVGEMLFVNDDGEIIPWNETHKQKSGQFFAPIDLEEDDILTVNFRTYEIEKVTRNGKVIYDNNQR